LLFVSLPPLALLVLVGKRLHLLRAGPSMAGEAPKILSTVALCAMAQPTLLRDPIEARLADGVGPIAILGAWLAGLWLAGRRSAASPAGRGLGPRPAGSPRSGRAIAGTAARAAGALGLLGITWMAVAEVAHPEVPLKRGRLADGPNAAAERASHVIDWLGTSPPIDAWDPSTAVGSQALLRYVHTCTKPTDHLLVTWFAPDYYFYSGRGFAGGQIFWFSRYYNSPADQQRTIERLEQQSVPIIISDPVRQREFRIRFPVVHEYVTRHYRLAGESGFGDARSVFLVLVDSRLASTGTYERLSLPCYA